MTLAIRPTIYEDSYIFNTRDSCIESAGRRSNHMTGDVIGTLTFGSLKKVRRTHPAKLYGIDKGEFPSVFNLRAS